jgi:hypothetical protein
VTSDADHHDNRDADRTADRTPLDQVVAQAADLLVYAPIGLFFDAPSVVPKLAEQGRVHARNARLFGELAVRHGEAEVRRRMDDVERQATDLLRMFGLVSDPQRPARAGADATPSDAAAATAARAAEQPAGDGVSGNGETPADATADVGPTVDDLAIPGYDSLSASQVVTRLEGLTPAELEAVRTYENAHRGRKTILNKVAQLQG